MSSGSLQPPPSGGRGSAARPAARGWTSGTAEARSWLVGGAGWKIEGACPRKGPPPPAAPEAEVGALAPGRDWPAERGGAVGGGPCEGVSHPRTRLAAWGSGASELPGPAGI